MKSETFNIVTLCFMFFFSIFGLAFFAYDVGEFATSKSGDVSNSSSVEAGPSESYVELYKYAHHCKQWEVRLLNPGEVSREEAARIRKSKSLLLPDTWEPFDTTALGKIWSRRCVK